jgi:hypothetical protein
MWISIIFTLNALWTPLSSSNSTKA